MKQFLIGSYAEAGTDAVFLVTLEEKDGTMTAKPVTAEVEQPCWLTASQIGRAHVSPVTNLNLVCRLLLGAQV